MATPDPSPPMRKAPMEILLERGLFASRWLLAPLYVGLALMLAALAASFLLEGAQEAPALLRPDAKPEDAILLALSLVDLSLAANLVLIVIFSGYESFVSKMDGFGAEDRPAWMGKVDFSGLKMKLIGSIVAISAIALLKTYLTLTEGGPVDERRLTWQVVIHLAFVVSGVLFALMDWLTSRTGREH
jgi:uncharacterized protein (TIGR00645 family)